MNKSSWHKRKHTEQDAAYKPLQFTIILDRILPFKRPQGQHLLPKKTATCNNYARLWISFWADLCNVSVKHHAGVKIGVYGYIIQNNVISSIYIYIAIPGTCVADVVRHMAATSPDTSSLVVPMLGSGPDRWSQSNNARSIPTKHWNFIAVNTRQSVIASVYPFAMRTSSNYFIYWYLIVIDQYVPNYTYNFIIKPLVRTVITLCRKLTIPLADS